MSERTDMGQSVTQVEKSAVLSEDGVYRYLLTRRWGPGKAVMFTMLNPSTADASVDDPTIRRCMGFARAWGYDSLIVWNLYAYRATNPVELDTALDPVGPDNNNYLWQAIEDSALVVAAWGAKPNRGRYQFRTASILAGFHDVDVYCLGWCKNDEPRHPLYVKGTQRPELYKAKTGWKLSRRESVLLEPTTTEEGDHA